MRRSLASAFLLILAACSGGDSPSEPLPVAIASVAFAVDSVALETGDATMAPSPSARASDGSVVSATPGRRLAWFWSTSDASVVAVNPATGRMVARSEGRATLTATIEGREGQVQVAVTAPVARSMTLVPAVPNLGVGDTTTVSITLENKHGMPIVRPVTWASTNASVLSVDSAGRVTAVGTGSASVTATADGVVQSVAMIISPNGLPFEFSFADDVPERVRVAMRAAARRWQRVVLDAGVPVVLPKQSATRCEALWDGQASRTFRGIAIRVLTADHEGRAFATGGMCVLRPGSRLPVAGVIDFDLRYIGDVSDEQLAHTAAHEIGHVLGIGEYGFVGGPFVKVRLEERSLIGFDGKTYTYHVTVVDDFHFTGPRAMSALTAAGGERFASVGVPLAEPPYTVGHWSPVLGDELMTPTYGSEDRRPLSLVTVQALADMGYVVHAAAAESYRVPTPSAVAARAAASAPVIDGGARF